MGRFHCAALNIESQNFVLELSKRMGIKDVVMQPAIPLHHRHTTVTLAPEVETVTLTVKQVQAINRLGLNGWKVELSECILARDGMLEGLMENKGGTKMFVGIHPEGSTHT